MPCTLVTIERRVQRHLSQSGQTTKQLNSEDNPLSQFERSKDTLKSGSHNQVYLDTYSVSKVVALRDVRNGGDKVT